MTNVYVATVQPQDPDLVLLGEPEGGGADRYLRPAIRVGPKMIPAVQRVVDRRGGPVVHVARTEGDRSGEVAQPPYPTRGVGLGTISSLEGGKSAKQQECSERACSAHDRLLAM